jgi:uncharacterized protein (DUF433 family)
MSSIVLKGVVLGKTIQLEREPGLPDGQKVMVQVQAEEEPPKWLERFTVDPSVALGKLLIKRTRLQAEGLAALVDQGKTDEELRQAYPELAVEDVDALRQYVKVPATMRRLFGAWAEDAPELDKFLDEIRLLRKLPANGTGSVSNLIAVLQAK